MKSLVFVYNANSGIGNIVLDVAHKIFSPKTYACNLCAITYDTFLENKEWKDFRKNSNLEMEFLHTDEFKEKYPNQNYKYPIVLTKNETGLSVLFSDEKLKSFKSSGDLILSLKEEIIS